jgi:hypothetical protein
MIIYNVTVNIDLSIQGEWLIWVNSHINEVLKTGKFTKATFTKIVTDESIGEISYSIQYYAKSKSDLEDYIKHYSGLLKSDGINRFGDKMLAFRTKLELIREFDLKSCK